MLSFYIIASILAFIQFNNYIEYSLKKNDFIANMKKCSSSSNDTQLFSRYEFFLIVFYNFIYMLFLMLIVVYVVYVINIFVQLDEPLLHKLLQYDPLFQRFIDDNDTFVKFVLVNLGLSFLSQSVALAVISSIRGKIRDNNKSKLKIDLFVIWLFTTLTTCITFLFL